MSFKPSRTAFVRDRFTWLAFLMMAFYGYLQAAPGPLMPFLRDELNLSYTVGGFHFSAFALGMILAGISGDTLARRLGRSSVFWAGTVGMAAGALWFILAQQVAMTIAAFFLMGYLGTLLLVAIQAALSDRHGDQRAIALTEANVASSSGAMLVPLFVGQFQQTGLGWRFALLLPFIALLLIIWRFRGVQIPESDDFRGIESKIHRRLPAEYWAYWLVIVVSVAIEWCLVFWGAEFLANVVGLPKTAAATAMSAFLLAMVVGRIAGSRLTRIIAPGALLLMMLSLVMIGFVIFWLARLTAVNLAGLFIAGLGVANLFPITLALCTTVAADQIDKASARISLGTGSAILLAPLSLGWLADQIRIENAFTIVALLIIVAIIVTTLTNRFVSKRTG